MWQVLLFIYFFFLGGSSFSSCYPSHIYQKNKTKKKMQIALQQRFLNKKKQKMIWRHHVAE